MAAYLAAGFPAAFGDFVPYQEEYSNEFLNSWAVPQSLHLPLLTAPLGGSITQWWVQPPSAPVMLSVVADFSDADVDLLISSLSIGISYAEASTLNSKVFGATL